MVVHQLSHSYGNTTSEGVLLIAIRIFIGRGVETIGVILVPSGAEQWGYDPAMLGGIVEGACGILRYLRRMCFIQDTEEVPKLW